MCDHQNRANVSYCLAVGVVHDAKRFCGLRFVGGSEEKFMRCNFCVNTNVNTLNCLCVRVVHDRSFLTITSFLNFCVASVGCFHCLYTVRLEKRTLFIF